MQFYPTLKKVGVKLMRGVENFQNRHSLIGTEPVLDNKEFPWVSEVEAAYPAIRAEPEICTAFRADIRVFKVIEGGRS